MRRCVWLFAWVVACTGSIGEPERGAGGSSPDEMTHEAVAADAPGPRFRCAGEAIHPPDRLRRLTRDELLRSVGMVLGEGILERSPVRDAAAQIPHETSGDLVTGFQNGYAFDHVEGMFRVAEAVAGEAADSPALRSRVLGECAAEADAACAEQLLDGVGLRLLKRPLDPQRRSALLQAFAAEGGGLEGMRHLLSRLLQSPEVMFHLEMPLEGCEDGGCAEPSGTDGPVPVDDWTVAARLAYAFTGRGPDEPLLAAARRGELRTEEAARTHAERLLATPAARRTLEGMFDSWLELRELPDANETVASAAGIDPEGLNEEARRELLEFVVHMVFVEEAGAAELMTAALGFPRSSRLAHVYGSELAEDGPVELLDGHRGLLLRAAPLLSGRRRSSPILRGVYVRKRILCDDLPSPDFNVVEQREEELEASDPERFSTREIITSLTSPNGCAQCHVKINPIGFALEEFGPLGEPRAEEIVYDAQGRELARHAIDTSVPHPEIEEGGPTSLEGADDLVSALASSAKVRSCLAERLYSQVRLRPVGTADHCLLAGVERALRDGLSIKDAWIRAVVNPGLFLRAVGEGAS